MCVFEYFGGNFALLMAGVIRDLGIFLAGPIAIWRDSNKVRRTMMLGPAVMEKYRYLGTINIPVVLMLIPRGQLHAGTIVDTKIFLAESTAIWRIFNKVQGPMMTGPVVIGEILYLWF